ncbi:hypothetical protein [Actinomadura rubrisoli]|uniref:Uncharacterized protein n=1 Tax=Actinomadura rubrisoli TaxID=2530368 RepID=A0A4R5AX62_9ACTN|nr:hypothetical protein [Actinomadura rubrisoli]TDD77701.1 hypothetical protein E1298_29675 [Actinomadura rubrisoli]
MASSTPPARHGDTRTTHPILFIPDRPPHLPLATAIRFDFRPSGAIVVEVNHRIWLRDLTGELTRVGTRCMNSRIWQHRRAGTGRPLRVEFTLDETLPRNDPVEYAELGGDAHVGIQPDISVDEALTRLMPMLSAGMRAHWDLRLPPVAGRCRVCRMPLDPDTGTCAIC